MINNVNFTGNPTKFFRPDSLYDAAKDLVSEKTIAAKASEAVEGAYTAARKLTTPANTATDAVMDASYAVSHGCQNDAVGKVLDKMM